MQGKDELGGLTRSFAEMTQQLADARAAVEKSMGQVDAARANLQTILDNLTAGVIVLDGEGIMLSSNPGATRMLRVPLAAYEGQPLADVPGLASSAQAVQQQFDEYKDERQQHGLDHWQQSFELHTSGSRACRSTPSPSSPAAPSCRARHGCWCSTTSPRSFPPSGRRPGARWRAAWRTRSRTR